MSWTSEIACHGPLRSPGVGSSECAERDWIANCAWAARLGSGFGCLQCSSDAGHTFPVCLPRLVDVASSWPVNRVGVRGAEVFKRAVIVWLSPVRRKHPPCNRIMGFKRFFVSGAGTLAVLAPAALALAVPHEGPSSVLRRAQDSNSSFAYSVKSCPGKGSAVGPTPIGTDVERRVRCQVGLGHSIRDQGEAVSCRRRVQRFRD